jgi:ABC-type branched-subunit amino acid transport system ATPase component
VSAKKAKTTLTLPADDLASLRDAERSVQQLDAARGRLRQLGREALGIGVPGEDRVHPDRRLSAVAATLGAAMAMPAVAVLVARESIADVLGAGPVALTAIVALVPIAAAAVAVPVAARWARARSGLTLVAAAVLSAALALAAVTTGQLVLALTLAVAGAAAGAIAATVPSTLADLEPPLARPHVFAIFRAGELGGQALVLLLAAVLVAGVGLTWRGLLLTAGELAFAAAAASWFLREPLVGRDERLVREAAVPQAADAAAPRALGTGEALRRVLEVRTVRHLLIAQVLLGFTSLPLLTYVLFYAEERWGFSPGGRWVLAAGLLAAGAAALAAVAARPVELYRQGVSRLLGAATLELLVAACAIVVAVTVPAVVVTVAALALAVTSLALVRPTLDAALFSVVPAGSRPYAAGLAAACSWGAAGIGGLVVLSGIDRRFGPGGALVVVALLVAQAAGAVRSAAGTVDDDVDHVVDDVVERAELHEMTARGAHLPMLACRHIDFSYGSLQVLFDVDFTVDDGEMVALLGTNGAGKSTLLRVISGLGIPSQGTVRLHGEDITYVDAERRMRLGISQVPGGRGVYGPLTVVENLRILGYANRDRKAVDSGIDAAFEAFPRLAERRNQLASTLSGGEQQMLSLSRAYLARPRLLLIDELSLGLSPKIVGELLEMVRRINAAGTAVVVVEQSVNVALSLVRHAYFMEKGEVRFDGAAAELLARPDLLRSVFLEGATRNGKRPARSSR